MKCHCGKDTWEPTVLEREGLSPLEQTLIKLNYCRVCLTVRCDIWPNACPKRHHMKTIDAGDFL